MLIRNAALISVLAPSVSSQEFVPILKEEPQLCGVVADPTLNRDSCGSVLIHGRALWTCRDTQTIRPDGSLDLSVVSSSASWTDLTLGEGPQIASAAVDGYAGVLEMYGGPTETPFFPFDQEGCSDNTAGQCEDGSRLAIWPDSPPMVAYEDDSHAVAYTWIKQARIHGFAPVFKDPAVTLYKLDHWANSTTEALPSVSVVEQDFWQMDQIDYGVYGNVVKDGVAYLYGQTSSKLVALARVPMASVENRSSYEYWVNGNWTTVPPAINCSGAAIANPTAGGQGTFYYSTAWSKFVWIGQSDNSIWADFYITTANNAEGPWATPTHFWSGVNGNATFPAYSLQAHPGLVEAGQNAIYLSYTKTDRVNGNDIYTTPLIYVEWAEVQEPSW